MHRWLDTSPAAMEYWEQVGAIEWEIIPDLADYHSEAAGALDVGRYLTNAVIDGSVLGEWRERLRVSPNFPVGMTYAQMHVKGRRSSSLDSDDHRCARGGHGDRAARRRARLRQDRRRCRRRRSPAPTRSPSARAWWPASSPDACASRASTSGCRHPSPSCSPTTSGAVVGVPADGPDGPLDAARTRRARHQHVRLESGSGQGVPGPGPRGLQQPGPDQPRGRRHHDGASRGRCRCPRAGHAHPDRAGLELAVGHRRLQRAGVRTAALPDGRHHGATILRRLVLGHHRRRRPQPRRPAPAVLPRLGRAAPPQVRAGAHAARWRVPRGVRQQRRRPRRPSARSLGRRR